MQYNVEFVKVSELKPYENNVKKHDEAQVEQIAKSIEQFGFQQNLVIDDDNVVVIGHGRLLAAEKLGIEEVPCIRVSDLTEEQVKALRIADNKISERGLWDNDALAEELKSIAESVDMTDFGFGDFELTVLLGEFEPEPYDDEDTFEYDSRETELLAKKRVIISYSPEDEDKVKELLKLEEIKKVMYDIREIG